MEWWTSATWLGTTLSLCIIIGILTGVNYQQATMSSMDKGTINLTESLAPDVEKLFVSTGLFRMTTHFKKGSVHDGYYRTGADSRATLNEFLT